MAIRSSSKARSCQPILWAVILVATLVVAGCTDEAPKHDQQRPPEANKTKAVIEPQAVETPISHRFAVQVGAFAVRANAESLAQRLSSKYDQTVLVAPTETPRGRPLYLVSIPVQTEAEAKDLATRISSEHELKTLVVSLP